MKKLTSSLAALLVAACYSQAQFVDLISLGSATYTIDPGVSIGAYSQSTSGTSFSPSVALGDTVGGTLGPVNWSSRSDLTSFIYLKIAFTGANPLLPISLTLFDPTFANSNTYAGTTAPIPEDSSYFKLALTSLTPGVLANVGGAQITWDGGGTVNANIQAIATVPEPSTYALLALAALVLGTYRARRRS